MTAANTRTVLELQEKGSSKLTPCTQSNNSNMSGGNNSKHYRNCKTCGKRYPGECCLLGNVRGDRCDSKGGKSFTKKDTQQYTKCMFAKQRKDG